MNKTVHSSAALLPPGIPISAQRIALPVTSLPKSVRCLTCTALNCWVRRKTLQRLHRELLNFGNDRNESHRGGHLQPRLSSAQRQFVSVRCRCPLPVRQRPAGRASVFSATREPKHGVFPQSGGETALSGGRRLLRRHGAGSIRF